MSGDFQTWFVVLVIAVVVSVAMQVGVLLALFYGMRRVQAKIKEIEGMIRAHGTMVALIAADVREALGSVKRVTNNAAELSDRVRATVDEAAEVSRRQLMRADQALGSVVSRFGRMSDSVESAVAWPVREMQALTAGLRAGLGSFFGRDPRFEGPRDQ